MSKKYTNLGTMMAAKRRDLNDPDEQKRFYLKFEQSKSKDGKPYGEQVFPITLANGKKIKDGDIVSMYNKREKFAKLVEEGKMSPEKADELSAFLIFDLVLVEDVDQGDGNSGGPNF